MYSEAFIESIKENLRLTMYEYDYLNEKEIDEKITQILSSISDEDLEASDFNMLCFEVKKQLMGLIWVGENGTTAQNAIKDTYNTMVI